MSEFDDSEFDVSAFDPDVESIDEIFQSDRVDVETSLGTATCVVTRYVGPDDDTVLASPQSMTVRDETIRDGTMIRSIQVGAQLPIDIGGQTVVARLGSKTYTGWRKVHFDGAVVDVPRGEVDRA